MLDASISAIFYIYFQPVDIIIISLDFLIKIVWLSLGKNVFVFMCGVVLRDTFILEEFYKYKNPFDVSFSRCFTRLIRLLFSR